jgi:hypothetical protein
MEAFALTLSQSCIVRRLLLALARIGLFVLLDAATALLQSSLVRLN